MAVLGDDVAEEAAGVLHQSAKNKNGKGGEGWRDGGVGAGAGTDARTEELLLARVLLLYLNCMHTHSRVTCIDSDFITCSLKTGQRHTVREG